MSDVYLLAFGGGVSFIAAGGFYVYLRECFTGNENPQESEEESQNVEPNDLRDVA
jgi:hypothetical protein